MGTTANRAIPYPDASEPIGLANEHQQDLAEWLDDELIRSRVYLEFGNLGQDIPNTNTDTVVGVGSSGTLEGGWTFDAGNNRWAYSGPDALFLVSCQLVFNVTATKGTLGMFVRGGGHPSIGGFDPLFGDTSLVTDFGHRIVVQASDVVACGPSHYDTLDIRAKASLSGLSGTVALDGGDFGGNRFTATRLRGL